MCEKRHDFTAEEVFLLNLAISNYGLDWATIVKVCLPSKTANRVEEFYNEQKGRKSFQLDKAYEEYEAKNKSKNEKKKRSNHNLAFSNS